MSDDAIQTNGEPALFDFSRFPANTLFHERRLGRDRRTDGSAAPKVEKKKVERRVKKDRRRRVDPTTFEKQYTEEEMEFMNAMQRFKELSGKTFPSYGDALKVAVELGYRRVIELDSDAWSEDAETILDDIGSGLEDETQLPMESASTEQ